MFRYLSNPFICRTTLNSFGSIRFYPTRRFCTTPNITIPSLTTMDEKPVYKRDISFTICTFNILSPCYNANETFDGYMSRNKKIIEDVILPTTPDILCLQEFQLSDAPKLGELYDTALSPLYDFSSLQRTGKKKDGLVIYTLKTRIRVQKSTLLKFFDPGNRVALMLELTLDGCVPLIAANVHLTFPHNIFDEKLRLTQIVQVTKTINDQLSIKGEKEKFPVIIAGDFNSPLHPLLKTDPVVDHLEFDQYINTFYLGRDKKDKPVTHFNHNREENSADHIWFKNYGSSPFDLQCVESLLLPVELPPHKWPSSLTWTLSDHRPLLSKFLVSVPKK
eukprot:TRINITY_DN6118_c0_g1_i1.p1 TRINITY_DN6118_c0_g1~~TRINITY_DN6118_c0_g1_i1.p1  ORF type:complete len:334 (-),score=61.55 TRINITY_DN6118_c0_g1_i1:140-1141(-)